MIEWNSRNCVYIFAVIVFSVLDTVVFVSKTQMNKIVARKVHESEQKKKPEEKTKRAQNIYAFSWRKTLYSQIQLCARVECLQSVETGNSGKVQKFQKTWTEATKEDRKRESMRETMMRRRLLWKKGSTAAAQSIAQTRR